VWTCPQEEWFKGTLVLLFHLVFTILIRICLSRLSWLVRQAASCTSHELGHAIHASSLSQGRSLESFIRSFVVGPTFGHGTLKLLLKASRNRQSTESWSTLHDELGSWLEKLVVGVA
jgi:hypothetical protein